MTKQVDRIIEYIKANGPTERHVLMEVAHASKGMISSCLSRHRAREGDRLYIHGWYRAPTGQSTAIVGYGQAADAPRPEAYTQRERYERWNAKKPRKPVTLSLYQKKIVDALTESPSTTEELHQITGVKLVTIRSILLKFRAPNRYGVRAHLSKWVRKEGSANEFVGVYTLGEGKDARKPKIGKNRSNREYMARYRAGRKLKVASVFHLGGALP